MVNLKDREETQEALDILAGLMDLEQKVDTCNRLRLEFIHTWDMLESSYRSMVMKVKYGQ